jgi:hypothetical protein
MEADGVFGRALVLPKIIADVVASRSLFGTFDQAEQNCSNTDDNPNENPDIAATR